MNQMDDNYKFLEHATRENTSLEDKIVLKTFENMLKACNNANKDNPSKCTHILTSVNDMKRVQRSYNTYEYIDKQGRTVRISGDCTIGGEM